MMDRSGPTDLALAVSGRLTRRHLRVLAYHGVADPEAFSRQLDYLQRAWNPVSAEDVVRAVRARRSLPDRAVWVTFDDGLRSSVVGAGALLADRGMSATAFVNPGVITSGQMHWWDVVLAAEGVERVRELKHVPDGQRREIVDEARRQTDVERRCSSAAVASVAELRAWVAAGHSVGNHTWDHPVLDQCIAADQEVQIQRSHEWLLEIGLMTEPIFAYPNGDWTEVAQKCLEALGYELGLLFDHRLSTLDDPLRVSRLRIDSSADVERLSLVLSGLHSGGFGLARKFGLRQ